MITLIVLGTAVTIVVVLFAAMLARTTPRRENRFAYSDTFGATPWIDGGAGSSDWWKCSSRRSWRIEPAHERGHLVRRGTHGGSIG